MTAADLVVLGAQLHLPEPTRSTALAVRGGRIAAVGADDELRALIGPGTEVLEAEGAAVLPGFHDGHVHAQAGGLRRRGCDLSPVHSAEEYRAIIAAHAAEHEDEWLVGSGWYGDAYPGGLPTARQLDAIVGERKAVLTSHDAHGVWASSAALRAAGIDRTTPDPPAGRIHRDADGEPTGVLFDAAGELVTRLLPRPGRAELERSLLEAQEHLLSLGVTAWHDAILGEYLTIADPTPAYAAAIASGELRARVSGSLWWPPDAGSEHLPELLERLAAVRATGMPVPSVKIMQDGICENCTAAMLGPYAGIAPPTCGESVVPPEELARITTALDALGIGVHFHAIGDRAVRECLDAVEAARRANGDGPRHQLAHLDVVDPADVPRFAVLGATANFQPLWARDDQEILERKYPLLGPERARQHFPIGALHRSGAHLAFGSDWPVTSPDPLWGLHSACTRTAPAADAHALNPEARRPSRPEQRIDVATAIRAYTLGPAEAVGLDDRLGRLEVGMLADLVELTGPIDGPDDFDRVRVRRTRIGGEAVHEAA